METPTKVEYENERPCIEDISTIAMKFFCRRFTQEVLKWKNKKEEINGQDNGANSKGD